MKNFLLIILVFCASSLHADDYLGAAAALHRAEELSGAGKTNQPASPDSVLRADLQKFKMAVTNMPPAEAAKEWLGLASRALKVQQQSMMNFDASRQPLDAGDLFDALPPPADWPALTNAIANLPADPNRSAMVTAGYQLLAACLGGDTEARKRAVAALEEKAAKATGQSMYLYRNALQSLANARLAGADNPDTVLALLQQQLNQMTGQTRPIQIPNLVVQIGEPKAEAFLRATLTNTSAMLQFQQPNETSRLAQKLVQELIGQLKEPQWGVINSLDAVDLYEMLDKRFGQKTNQPTASAVSAIPGLSALIRLGNSGDAGLDQFKSAAKIYYLMGLIAKDRTKDATALARSVTGGNFEYAYAPAFKAMEKAGYTEALDNFLYAFITADPSSVFWDEYVGLSAQAGTTDRMLKLAQATAARADLSDKKKAAIRFTLCKALLAADSVDEGVEQIRRLMTNTPASMMAELQYNQGQLGVMLAQLGMLMQKPAWTDEGLVAVKKWLATYKSSMNSAWEFGPVIASATKILDQLNRGPEAEALVVQALAAVLRPSEDQNDFSYGLSAPAQLLANLALIYHQAGRGEDVLALLQQSPDWGVKDLSGLFNNQMGADFEEGFVIQPVHTGQSPTPVAYMAADALIKLGRKAEAEKIVDELLFKFPGLDRGYELLLELKGTNAIPQLDALFARDQFEERPLIWKAHLLREENKLDEAEKVARQAIAIDPSDGEEGPGDRMRVYAELADIREAQGNAKDADFYRQVVKAIRLSETADSFYKAGLLKRAIPMYEEGLQHFSDAYCIQSRLAIQLSDLGLTKEAEEHYRRAFELMPDSFGRVESHCFGCERAFDGEKAQSIADQVFTKLVAQRPNKPQIHYLLGYLREQEERYNEAETNYLAATALDPQYLNAWIRLDGIEEHVVMPAKQRDEIVFNILRLDPLGRHGGANFQNVSDLARLWKVEADNQARRPVANTNLFPLTASAMALQKKPKNNIRAYFSNDTTETPGRAVGQTAFVSAAGQLIFGGGFGGGDE